MTLQSYKYVTIYSAVLSCIYIYIPIMLNNCENNYPLKINFK